MRWSFPARLLLLSIIFLSVGNFQPSLTGADEASALQQSIVLVLWLALIGLSFLPGALAERPTLDGLLWPLLFLGYAAVSPAWSGSPQAGLAKSAVLLVTSFGAWRVAGMMRTESFFEVATYALLLIALASVLLVLFVPSIGVLATWQHSGQWSGVFISKQLLGTAAAFLLLFALLRLAERKRVLDVLGLVLGGACVLGSGSRGGAALAVAAVICILLARRSVGAAIALSLLPLLLILVALIVASILAYTGYDYLPVFGTRVDLTERTLIWQYGLGHWLGQPIAGFGLNGFWSDEGLYYSFLKKHGWVLDNFHSGYNTIIVELGLFGLALFVIVTARLCWSVARRVVADFAGERRCLSHGVELALGFMILFFTINLTETFLLRSTNFFQFAFTFLLVRLLSRHPPASARP